MADQWSVNVEEMSRMVGFNGLGMNLGTLSRLSAARAKHFYALVYPRDSWWTRLGGQAGNAILALQRSKFRFFVHPAQQVDAIVRAAGLQPRFHGNAGLIWQVVVYARS